MSDDLDRKVTPEVLRLVDYYSGLINIRTFWEAGGLRPLDWLKEETDRVHVLLEGGLKRAKEQRGAEDETRQGDEGSYVQKEGADPQGRP